MATEQEITLESIVANRIATYGFLARLYRKEIDQSLLDEMCKMKYPTNTGNADVDEGYRLICTYLCGIWERTLEELAVDFTKVFLGSGMNAYSAAYPFESVHTSARRLLMQDARDEVLAVYRAAGLAKSDNWKEGEDHIALELEFMQVLCTRALDALNAGDEDKAVDLFMQQYNFLQDHLLNWTPMLVGEMEKFAKTDMYRGLGKLTIGFLKTDREFLEDILEEELAALQEGSSDDDED
ncbi:MAG: molecular chaperone TorD family protein [Coriobacteriales bacterium]|nr:molecular chaperone TorD family protein [Coriobacteriales bacterium]MBQ6585617.1 molecular chaperone TorD family protein [Coriobacteriales bacterium]